jgi:hypothetical protein
MGRWDHSTSRIRSAVRLVVLLLVGGFSVLVAGGVATGKAPSGPKVPRCSKLSVNAISKLVGVGKLYRDTTLVRGTSCQYYGWPKKKADNPPTVASNKIKYVPALLISVSLTSSVGYYYLTYKLDEGGDNQKLSYGGVPPKAGLGKDARIYYGVINDKNQPACSPGILENNWTGPPACKPQPSLQKITVAAYRGSNHGVGLAVLVSASAEYPSHLTQAHIERVAKDALNAP